MVRNPDVTIIDMTPEGGFVPPARPLFGLRATGLTIAATAIATAAVSIVLLVWLTITLLPIVAGVAVGIYALKRLRSYQRRSRLSQGLQRWSGLPGGR